MMKRDLPSGALAFLRRSRGANALVIVATALCMGCFLVMRSFGAGGASQFASSLSSGDPREIIVSAGSTGQKLNDAAVQAFKSISGVEAATGVIELPLQIKVGSYEAGLDVVAADADALRGRLGFSSGGLFAGGAAPQLVLGWGAQMKFESGAAPQEQSVSAGSAQSAAPTPPPVKWFSQQAQISFAGESGDKGGGDGAQEPNPARLYAGNIAGILKEDKSDRNDQAFMSLSAAKKMLQENYDEAAALGLSASSYTQAYVFVDDIGKVQAVMDALAQMGFPAQSAVTDLESLQLELSLQQTLLTVIEMFSVIIAFLSALCALLSRRHEHAEPLGARLLGSAALGLTGGLAAALLACFFALLTNTSSTETVLFGMHFGQSFNLSVPFGAMLETIGISIAVAAAAAMAPPRSISLPAKGY